MGDSLTLLIVVLSTFNPPCHAVNQPDSNVQLYCMHESDHAYRETVTVNIGTPNMKVCQADAEAFRKAPDVVSAKCQ